MLRRSLLYVMRRLPSRFRTRLFRLVFDAQPDEAKLRTGYSMRGSLGSLRRNGLSPQSVIDIGAYVGHWTRDASDIFPDARFWMVEANPAKDSTLKNMAAGLGAGAGYTITLLGPEERESVPFYLMETGSSVFEEQTTFERNVVHLPMTTLDALVAELGLPEPFFLKLDVQGYELEVLAGGSHVLQRTAAALLEVSLLEYNRSAPLLADVVGFMAARGFVVYDISGHARRQSDGALFQVDLIFVPETSPLRARRRFWTAEP